MKYPPLLYLFVVCCLLIASIHFFFFKPQKSRKPRKTRVLKYGGEVEHKGGRGKRCFRYIIFLMKRMGKGKTVKLMTTDKRVFHCILVHNINAHTLLILKTGVEKSRMEKMGDFLRYVTSVRGLTCTHICTWYRWYRPRVLVDAGTYTAEGSRRAVEPTGILSVQGHLERWGMEWVDKG